MFAAPAALLRGRGGGLYDRDEATDRNEWNSDDEDVDEFGRKKSRKKRQKVSAAEAKRGKNLAKDKESQESVHEKSAASPEECSSPKASQSLKASEESESPASQLHSSSSVVNPVGESVPSSSSSMGVCARAKELVTIKRAKELEDAYQDGLEIGRMGQMRNESQAETATPGVQSFTELIMMQHLQAMQMTPEMLHHMEIVNQQMQLQQMQRYQVQDMMNQVQQLTEVSEQTVKDTAPVKRQRDTGVIHLRDFDQDQLDEIKRKEIRKAKMASQRKVECQFFPGCPKGSSCPFLHNYQSAAKKFSLAGNQLGTGAARQPGQHPISEQSRLLEMQQFIDFESGKQQAAKPVSSSMSQGSQPLGANLTKRTPLQNPQFGGTGQFQSGRPMLNTPKAVGMHPLPLKAGAHSINTLPTAMARSQKASIVKAPVRNSSPYGNQEIDEDEALAELLSM
eukprot:gnl/MRDRNA2_/MRDRNA2_33653_c0_seq2.p1 gnl/MRDRNA2_/MRDRNA2_33653_c0~~gnl/MRDRNA2_/MRDRNA2_33653_c0_seq2.p1  ORF type:complete len:476 (+),score=118.91 gnl/MRDRNA2_/MRDRNA2_33653_c0_seq2:75-1430(+)